QVAVVQVDRGGAGSVVRRDHGVVRGSVYPGEVRQSGALVRAGAGDGGLRGEPDQSRFRVPGRQDRRRYLVARLRLRPRTGSARVGSSGSLVGLSARGGRPRGAEQASVLQNVQRMVREEETWLVFTRSPSTHRDSPRRRCLTSPERMRHNSSRWSPARSEPRCLTGTSAAQPWSGLTGTAGL